MNLFLGGFYYEKVLMLVLAVFLIVPIANAQAADVPSFYQVGGRYLTFTGRENAANLRTYGYNCNVDLNENFAEHFMSSLSNFQMVGHYFNDYRRTSAETFEYWVFVYTGSKYAPSFIQKDYHKRQTYNAHLVVGRHKNWQRGTTHFSIKLSNGLTYGED